MNSLQKLLSHTNLKKCKTCGEIKETKEFYKNGKNYQSNCKKCVLAQRKDQYNKNPQKYLERVNKYQKENPDKTWAKNTVTQHRKRGFEIKATYEEIQAMYRESIDKPCIYCGKMMEKGVGQMQKNSPTLDIIHPQIRVLEKNNMQVICYECNTVKGTKAPAQFIRYCMDIVKRYQEGQISL